jgi:O-Antigen ligase
MSAVADRERVRASAIRSPAGTATAPSTSTRLHWSVRLFLIGLVVPWVIPVGPLNLSVYRILLLIMLLPCTMIWISGRAGRIRFADISMGLYSAWASLTLFHAEGVDGATQTAGIFVIETFGTYLLARCYIRTADQFGEVTTTVAKLVAILLPFAMYEWFTGRRPLLWAFGIVFPTVEPALMEQRLGFWRVQGSFPHPIAFGLFCGSVFALMHFVGRGSPSLSHRLRTILVVVTASLSMSSAPIAGLVIQGALIAWNWLLKGYRSRWNILFAIVLVCSLVVEVASNQGLLRFYISHFTFDKETGWFRILIWNYGSASVLDHPFLGIGLNDWVRPKWMPDSVDNFWLLTAMRHGLPGLFFLICAYLSVVFAIGKKQLADPALQDVRTGYLICMATFFFVGLTVHLWAAPYAWFMFLLGGGVWLLDIEPGREVTEAPARRSGRNAQRLSSENRKRAFSTRGPFLGDVDGNGKSPARQL